MLIENWSSLKGVETIYLVTIKLSIPVYLRKSDFEEHAKMEVQLLQKKMICHQIGTFGYKNRYV
jgi:hypothetical protein